MHPPKETSAIIWTPICNINTVIISFLLNYFYNKHERKIFIFPTHLNYLRKKHCGNEKNYEWKKNCQMKERRPHTVMFVQITFSQFP